MINFCEILVTFSHNLFASTFTGLGLLKFPLLVIFANYFFEIVFFFHLKFFSRRIKIWRHLSISSSKRTLSYAALSHSLRHSPSVRYDTANYCKANYFFGDACLSAFFGLLSFAGLIAAAILRSSRES